MSNGRGKLRLELPHKSMRPNGFDLRRCLCLGKACAIIDAASPDRRNCNPFAMILTCSSRTTPYHQRPHAEDEA
jgi:hypothetical protein